MTSILNLLEALLIFLWYWLQLTVPKFAGSRLLGVTIHRECLGSRTCFKPLHSWIYQNKCEESFSQTYRSEEIQEAQLLVPSAHDQREENYHAPNS